MAGSRRGAEAQRPRSKKNLCVSASPRDEMSLCGLTGQAIGAVLGGGAMNKEKLFRLIGTIAQVLAMIALIPYQFGDIALIFPHEVKVLVLKIAIAAYIIGRLLSMFFGVKFDVSKPPEWDSPKTPVRKPADKRP